MLIILQRGKTVCVTVQSLHLNTRLQLQKWSWMLRKIQRYVCNSSENDKASAFSLVRVQPAQGKRQWRLGGLLSLLVLVVLISRGASEINVVQCNKKIVRSTYSSAFWRRKNHSLEQVTTKTLFANTYSSTFWENPLMHTSLKPVSTLKIIFLIHQRSLQLSIFFLEESSYNGGRKIWWISIDSIKFDESD